MVHSSISANIWNEKLPAKLPHGSKHCAAAAAYVYDAGGGGGVVVVVVVVVVMVMVVVAAMWWGYVTRLERDGFARFLGDRQIWVTSCNNGHPATAPHSGAPV